MFRISFAMMTTNVQFRSLLNVRIRYWITEYSLRWPCPRASAAYKTRPNSENNFFFI